MKKDDIITPLTEQVAGLLGETARIPKSDLYVQSGDIGLIVPNEKLLDKNFVYYLISSPMIKKQLGAMAQQTKIRHTSPEKIKSCEAIIPEIETQKKIGSLLRYIDEEIEHNNNMNKESEKIAKTIYDYWFLQFEFPNEEGKPYKLSGGKMVWNEELKRRIPEEWKVKKIIEIEKNIITGKTPPTKDIANFGGNIPFITINDIRKGTYINTTERTLTIKGADLQKNKYIPENAICVTCIATIGLVGITTKKSQTNQQINSIICTYDKNRYFLLNAIRHYFRNSVGAKAGNIFDNMNKEDFSSIKLIYPNNDVLERYAKIVKPIYNEIKDNILKNEELIKLKDYLLPLLMNGQVCFKETDK